MKINSPNALIEKVIDRVDPNKMSIYVIYKKCTLRHIKIKSKWMKNIHHTNTKKRKWSTRY